MGIQVSIRNDTDEVVTAEVKGQDGKEISGWKLTIPVGDEKRLTTNFGLEVGVRHKLLLSWGPRPEDKMEQRFWVPRPRGPVHLTATMLKSQTQLRMLEAEHLIEEIMPGMRIEDRNYHGKTYKRCFVANELVTYLLLHRLAADTQEAIEKCQALVKCRIIEHVCTPQDFKTEVNDFENKYLFYRLRETHKMVAPKMESLTVDELISEPRRSSMRFRSFINNRLMSIRGLEGWLEKRSKLGLWQKRYFRVLVDDESKLGNHIAYFENTTSLTPKGIIPSDEINLVEMYEYSKQNRTFRITMTNDHNGKNSYILRAPSPDICLKWLGALKPFAQTLSSTDVVSRSALVFVFTDEMIRVFAKMLKPISFKAGEWICQRGERADDFYLLRNGKIGIYIRTRHGQEILYCQQTPISFFGESVFISQSSTVPLRKASCKAMEDCELLVLSQKDREEFMKKFHEIKGQLFVLLQTGIEKRIAQVPFLKGLKPNDIAKLKLGLHYQSLRKNEVLFYEGDPGSDFFIVYAGALKIVQYDQKNDKEVLLKTVGKADCFGEIALLLSGIPRTATVVATAPTLLLSLSEETFKSFMKIAGLKINVIMRERIVNTFKQYHIPFFEAIPEKNFKELATVCRIESFSHGEAIFKEGEDGDRFYIISFGEVAVSVDGKEIALLHQGAYFGEIALVVEDTPRTATCIATRKTVLLSMSKVDFRGFFEDRPEALADVELKIAGKKCQIRSIMYHPKGVEFFTNYLKKQYAEESMEFWHEVRAYRKWAMQIDLVDQKAIQKKAEEIMNKYIKEGSERQVNISSKMAKEIIKEVEANNASPLTFVDSEKEVITLLSRDKLGSFKQSEEFRKLMAKVGGYQVNAKTKAKGGKKRGGSRIDLGAVAQAVNSSRSSVRAMENNSQPSLTIETSRASEGKSQ